MFSTVSLSEFTCSVFVVRIKFPRVLFRDISNRFLNLIGPHAIEHKICRFTVVVRHVLCARLFVNVHLYSKRNKSHVINDFQQTDTEKHLETFEPDVTISNPAMTDNTEREPTSMSDEDDPSTTDTSSSSSSEFELDLTNIREGRYYVT